MQKFTRPITREIELAGQRIAVTLDEMGLAMRPIGARQPPREITWADLAALLEARPAAAAEPASETSTGETPLHDSLRQLNIWLREHRPVFHSGLMRGANDREIGELADALGHSVPQELEIWLRWHNGQADGAVGSLVGAFNPLSAEEIAEIVADRPNHPEDGPWNPAWIPLLDDFQGDLVCLDSSRPGCPVLELWGGHDDPMEVAPTLTAWVEQFLHDCLAGRYVEEPERGEFLRRS
jgi:cell wall assembly regulator SMI1